MNDNPTEKFSTRVENYKKYRPHYPIKVIEELNNYLHQKKGLQVADIGSGTGIFTERLLEVGYSVFAVEPNEEMRQSAEKDLSLNPDFHSINGTAENSTLPEESIDLITAAQSFHWFSPEPTLKEFQRILKPEGLIAFLWNERDNDASSFLKEYDLLLCEACPSYETSPHLNIGKQKILDYIEEISLEEFHFSNYQEFDKEGFIGRVLSSSYTPLPDSPDYISFITKITALFNKHQENGKVNIQYNTHLYLGRVLLPNFM
ncbi:MAG: class I SAM-dependent methyltransferase [Promethearchaeota archaeon]